MIKLHSKEQNKKDSERQKAEQVAYDVGMNKIAQSLTAQLRDIAWTFWLKMGREALNAAGVNVESVLRGSDQVY